MSMTEVEPVYGETPERDDLHDPALYRALSRPAVASLVLGVLSLAALLFPTLLILPAAGVLLAGIAIRSIKRYPDEWSGLTIARLGYALCGLMLVGGIALHATVYAMEVPEGFQRISFYDLQPDDDQPDMPIPSEAVNLDGQKVFIKGYVYPDGQQSNIKRFVLVPDRGTCCFGGQPKLTDMIEVTLRDPHRIRYSYQLRKLAGTLRVDTRLKPVSGLGGVYYQLDAEYVQ